MPIDLGTLITLAYKLVPVTPENSKAVREACWALLANVLASDYANGWNEAADHKGKDAERLLDHARFAADRALERPSSLAHYANGLVLRAEGKHEPARDAFQRAIELDGEFARAYAQKGTELMYLDKLDDALAAINEAIRRGPGDHSLGIMKFDRGRVLCSKTRMLRLSNHSRKRLFFATTFGLRGCI
jgi:tetratricopeptide (TPR) repeat protein